MSYFQLTTTHGSTFPSPQWAIEAHGADWIKPENIVSNGAYVLTKHVPNETLVRERNPMYWNNAETIMEKVVIKIVNDENVALTRYLSGEFDQTAVPAGQFLKMQEQYPDEVHSNPKLCTYYYSLNMGVIRTIGTCSFLICDPMCRAGLPLTLSIGQRPTERRYYNVENWFAGRGSDRGGACDGNFWSFGQHAGCGVRLLP